MAQQIIDIGTVANDGTGDLIRDAFSKANTNYNELYAGLTMATTGLFKWGLGAYWSGKGYEPLTSVNSDNDWDSISVGDTHGLGIKAGKLYSWGSNSSGKTGLSITTGNTIIPTQVGSATDWWIISAGFNFSFGIRKTWNTDHYDYTLWAWGESGTYATGTGSTTDLTVPTQIGTDTDWEWVSGGFNGSSAIKNGLLYTCGNNSSYATGQNINTGSTTTWTNYDGGSTGWTKCYSGYDHGIGIRGGELWSWGVNTSYKTGRGTAAGQTQIPTKVGVITNWVSGDAGYAHSGVINSNGELFMFGEGDNGRLGSGGTTDYTAPTQIGTDTDWEKIAAYAGTFVAGYHEYTYALKGGKLYATGVNTFGQCGQSISTSQFTTFQQIGTGTNYIDIAAGGGFGMAIQQSTTTTTTTTTII